ncbi:Bud site selection protein BUD4 [Fulvia fulva]|uniref:Bud site selection protein BUD4 n=1 Tax=Passalora fulva TaxID=5499 RepID=A0A9Q8P962_PASFU|nr:Bud site selection protein BUD4 [Fulvia fulva]KAK4624605.1 Bud site selection protein BUD4 [Fulvia fulva]KAK4625976.1 Bud site selection protein BUD4 [Fulvia fulva]UJO17818.1 Bud site selection protein BUD4 [Fulvia fulva]WPV15417.1 Bud site selection protein BUD4 [Fulvia fulva]WPV29476.1 Bud site selection protein BUD4 [Fulvia fulva]
MVRQVQPLRISKSTPNVSPTKLASPRPLAEIGNTERRRNSPSYNQATKKMIVSRESSPYADNSFTKENASSPRAFWSTRESMSNSRFDDTENTPEREPSPGLLSPKRRASIEKLKQAGRVKTSNIFALENKDSYDPNNLPIVERPSANRPLSQYMTNNSFTRNDSLRKENSPFSSSPLRSPTRPGHKRMESDSAVSMLSKPSSPIKIPLPSSPQKEGASPASPTKSSLSRTSQFGSSLEHVISAPWSDGDDRAPTPRAIHRHNKSVTFNEEAPVVNEYENPTPEPSVSAASGSRESSWDSDDYDQNYSFERGSSVEHRDDSFDEDLENADKTPVVLPEDWSRMSPEEARTDLIDDGDDVFEGSSPVPQRAVLGRSESVTSDGESRPLPPLPGLASPQRASLGEAAERASHAARNLPSPPKRESCSLGQYDEERPSSKHSMDHELTITNLDTGEQRDVQVNETGIIEDNSTVDDVADFAAPKISRESILRNVRNSKYEFDDEDEESVTSRENSPARPTYTDLARMHPDEPVPSRENSRETSEHHIGAYFEERAESEDIEIKAEPTDDDGIDMNSIPVLEDHLEPPRSPSRLDDYERQSSVLRHDVGSPSEDGDESGSRYSSVEPEAESTTLHAQHENAPVVDDGKESLQDAMQLLSVKDYSQAEAETRPTPKKSSVGDFMGLPAYLSSDDFDFGMGQYIEPSPPQSHENTKQLDITANAPVLPPAADIKPAMKDLPRPAYDGAEFSPPPSPSGSVIHHSESQISVLEEPALEEPERDSPVIPERRATIRTNGQLKARPSATPADFATMAEQRRTVSASHPVPAAIPEAYRAEVDQVPEATESDIDVDEKHATTYSSEGTESKADSAVESSAVTSPETKRRESRKMAKLNLEIPSLAVDDQNDGLGLDQAFDRVIESQKVRSFFPPPLLARSDLPSQQARSSELSSFNSAGGFDSPEGLSHAPTPFSPQTNFSAGTDVSPRKQKGYLMRQHTKVVVASNRNFSNSSRGTVSSNENAPTSPTSSRPSSRGFRGGNSRKPSAEQYLKTEPWNGKARRESQRQASAAQHGPAPPLPGHQSALGVVNEDFAAGTGSLEDEVAEGVERGRLFVKVAGVKNLDLPLPRNNRLHFQMTLDNGLHCVTTSKLELGQSAPIGQEFELVVLNDLEFQLTLTTKLPPPPRTNCPVPSSPTKTPKHAKSSSLSRFLTSPKKRAEKERQEREAAEAEEQRLQDEARRKRASTQPTAWDLLHDLVNESDGSFARAYVNLKAHEKQCFGRKLTVDVPCYNEWALENDSHVVNSVRSKRGNHGPIRRPPYVVGHLEVELLYVPKPAGAADEEMPKSMSSAVREMGKASEVKEVVHEGLLSQQGGDCTHWRRRLFRLQGPRLTAYHEHTHQKRAVINLGKASRLVDDKSTLVANPKSGNPSKHGRRKSAFAEEDEGYQYVEEGFRIRFANGETIDFYADSRGEKDLWMEALSQVIGKPDPGRKAASWTDLVLARERAEGPPTPRQSSLTEMRDFTKPPPPVRKNSVVDRKPVSTSKSVPSSPMKGVRAGPPLADQGSRPKTPPMSARRGHRSRNAVKSMIF